MAAEPDGKCRMTHECKERALAFLDDLERYLTKRLPAPERMRDRVKDIVQNAITTGQKHLNEREPAFMNHFLAPLIHKYLVEAHGLTPEDARHALLSESWKAVPDIASNTPARTISDPFGKTKLGTKDGRASAIFKRWCGQGEGRPVKQSCPDIALRRPSPHAILIEGKYFHEGGKEKAGSELVKGIYETFFYRGLARRSETPTRPAWDYEYACMVAYDSTNTGTLVEAWNSIGEEVRTACWEASNIYVMILRGTGTGDAHPMI